MGLTECAAQLLRRITLVRTVGVICILLGGSIFALGFRTYWDVSQDTKEEEVEATSAWFLGLLTLLLLVASGLALVLVFL